MSRYKQLIDEMTTHMTSFFESNANPSLIYHNAAHTKSVVAAAIQIGQHYDLKGKENFIVMTAAWFHDTGYCNGTSAKKHEERGVELMEEYLKSKDVDPEIIERVRGCILSTKLPQHPVNLLEQIVCDADLFHLGTDNFFERDKLMRKEAEWLGGKEIPKDDWRKFTIKLMEEHAYHTEYCRSLLTESKARNLEKLKRKEQEKTLKDEKREYENSITDLLRKHDADSASEKNDSKDEKKKGRPDRGIETVFRITSSNNQQLSTQADNKANIMIQVNSIIISVLLSLLLGKAEGHMELIIPTFILISVNVTTIIFAVLATRPTIPKGTFNTNDIDAKKVNLLFFGNFYRMPLDEYAAGMLKMMDDRDFLYGSLIRDVYFQGIILGKKYRLLRIAYNVFMFGLIASVLAFIISALTVSNV